MKNDFDMCRGFVRDLSSRLPQYRAYRSPIRKMIDDRPRFGSTHPRYRCRRRWPLDRPLFAARGSRGTVIDLLPPASGASFGNAGLISADTSVPIALPGMLRKVPGWLNDRLGPLSVDPRYFPKALPWLLRWVEAGRMTQVPQISDAMRAMHSQTFECWKELLGSNRYHDLIRPLGQVHVWETEQETPGAALSAACGNAREFAPSGWLPTICASYSPASAVR